MARSLSGPRVEDPRYRAVLAERTEHEHHVSRGVSAWSRGALERHPLRLPELVLGFLLALEAYSVSLGPFAVPVNEVAGLALALAVPVGALASDTKAPVVVSSSASPSWINVTGSSQTVTVTFRVTDDDSGVVAPSVSGDSDLSKETTPAVTATSWAGSRPA